MGKVYFAIEQVRSGRLLSEIATGNDHLLGYKGYILDPAQKLFTQESLDEGLISMGNVDRIKIRITDVNSSYGEVKNVLKGRGATHCIYCSRAVDDCVDYSSCEKLTRIE